MVTLESIDARLYYGTPGPSTPVGPMALESLRTIDITQPDEDVIEATLRVLWRSATGSQWPSMREGAKVHRTPWECIATGNGWTVSWRLPGWAVRQDELRASIKEGLLDTRRAGRPHHG